MLYRIPHISTLYNVSEETVRLWGNEFSSYLSPTGNPGKRKHRFFTEDDMRVFALISELKSQGQEYKDIHLALRSGQRGNPPSLPPDQIQAIVASDREKQLTVENHYLQQELLKAKEELKAVEGLRTELQQAKEENIRMTTRVESLQNERERREAELKTYQARLEAQIMDLARELGREYARGFTEGLKDKDNPK